MEVYPRRNPSTPVPAWVLMVASLVFAGYAFTNLGGARLALALVFGIGGTGALYLYALVSRRRMALFWDGQRLVFRGTFYRARTIVSSPGGGSVVRVDIYNSHQPKLQLWLDADGICRAMLPEVAWDLDELEALRLEASLPIETDPNPMDVQDLAKRYPGSVPVCLARPIMSATLAWVVVLTLYLVARGISRT